MMPAGVHSLRCALAEAAAFLATIGVLAVAVPVFALVFVVTLKEPKRRPA